MAQPTSQAIQDEARHLLTLRTPHDVIADRLGKDRTTIWRWARKWGFPTDAGEPSTPSAAPSTPSAGEPSAPSVPRTSARTVRGVRAASVPSAAPSARPASAVEAENVTLRARVTELERQVQIMREAAFIMGQGLAR